MQRGAAVLDARVLDVLRYTGLSRNIGAVVAWGRGVAASGCAESKGAENGDG